MSAPYSAGVRQLLQTAVLGAIVATAVGCSGGGKTATVTTTTTSGSIAWHGCPGGQCATLRVPLDYAHPAGPKIGVALFKLPATDPAQRIGTLVINPGGPGEPGAGFVRRTFGAFGSREVRARYDVIGFDPRGTGQSEPVQCGPAFGRLLERDWAPQTAAERTALGQGQTGFWRACEQRVGPVLGHVGSVDTARDIETLRRGLGERQISYVGYSYGTYLGQVYAGMYPTHVRAMVLDGVVDPSLDGTQNTLSQAKGFEASLDAFLAECSRKPSCAFHSDGRAGAAFDALEARIQAHPLRVGSRTLGPTQFWDGAIAPLYSASTALLADALAAADRGNGRPLLAIADAYDDRQPDGSYGSLLQSYEAITCLDGQTLGPASRIPSLEPEFRRAAPRTGIVVLYSSAGCSYWQGLHPQRPKLPITAQGAPPILVVGATGDPATPYSGAVAVAKRLASGVLITSHGTRHTSEAALGGPCDALVVPYLVSLRVPPPGSTC